MLKGKVYWIFVSILIIGVVGYRVKQNLPDNPIPYDVAHTQAGAESQISPSVTSQQHPLLSADREDVKRWFPFTCFAEIYMQSGEPGNCKGLVVGNIKAETGVSISESDFLRPDVVAHFKDVYGSDGPWR